MKSPKKTFPLENQNHQDELYNLFPCLNVGSVGSSILVILISNE